MTDTKINPDNVLISMILTNPTPAVFKITDDASARKPINGNMTIDNTKQTLKLLTAYPCGLVVDSTSPEWRPEDNLAPKILIRLPLSPENSGIKVSKLGFESKLSTALFKIPPAEHPKKEHKSKTGVDCLNIVFVSSDNL